MEIPLHQKSKVISKGRGRPPKEQKTIEIKEPTIVMRNGSDEDKLKKLQTELKKAKT